MFLVPDAWCWVFKPQQSISNRKVASLEIELDDISQARHARTLCCSSILTRLHPLLCPTNLDLCWLLFCASVLWWIRSWLRYKCGDKCTTVLEAVLFLGRWADASTICWGYWVWQHGWIPRAGERCQICFPVMIPYCGQWGVKPGLWMLISWKTWALVKSLTQELMLLTVSLPEPLLVKLFECFCGHHQAREREEERLNSQRESYGLSNVGSGTFEQVEVHT